MPDAPLRLCPGCGTAWVTRGRCGPCMRLVGQVRGTRHARGYGRAWEGFRREFFAALVAAGVAPVCGAVLPGGPVTTDSQCQRADLLEFERINVDHAPPLTEAERKNVYLVCDLHRVQALCSSCHSAKTRGEQLRRGEAR